MAAPIATLQIPKNSLLFDCINETILLIELFHLVTNAPHHLYIFRILRINFYLLSNVADMHHDRIFYREVSSFFPHTLVNLFRRKYLSRI